MCVCARLLCVCVCGGLRFEQGYLIPFWQILVRKILLIRPRRQIEMEDFQGDLDAVKIKEPLKP